MMEYVRQGDTVIVESISRFARNTRDLLELVERLTTKGVEFVSKKEAIDHPDFQKVTAAWRRGEVTAVQAMRRLGMSKATFYRRVKYGSRTSSI